MPDLPLALGLDAGGSGTKWALLRGQEVLARGTAPPLTAALLQTGAGEAALAALVDALPLFPEALHAGVPGLTQGTPAANRVRDALARPFSLPASRTSVEGDLDLAYRTHLAPGEGVLLYAGTGSIAYHVGASGEVVRAGGRGYRIGDDGGGFSLGREALRRITDVLDRGEEPTSLLAAEVAAVTGRLDWDTLRSFAYGTPGAAAVARLAPAVGRAADRADGVALGLLDDAARSLAQLAQRVQARTGPLPVIATGGALRISPAFPTALKACCPGVQVMWKDHAEVAARLGMARLLL
ncbi:N-acetylglucosamine kinase [Deinococcus hopiensis]|uniref:BadF-type ATPase n=1 Tax=Deinococcus hopiensis KR-140 TaxID=695939 RepID=A0A1W1UGG9_9DEIO|nr:BadF/BadG/BcrA/BcrD ATPase family protein [Deinococcus hopiensis]SMB79864.1 BadF-type ATPase [Deinococcus hopiensis KR-140]